MPGMNPKKMRQTVAAGGLSVRDVNARPIPLLKANPMQWGRAETFNPPWTENESRPLLSIDNMNNPGNRRVPKVQNLVLILTGFTEAQQDSVFRWVIEFGAGGGKTTIRVDAAGTQQLSLSAETMRVSLQCTGWGPNWTRPLFRRRRTRSRRRSFSPMDRR